MAKISKKVEKGKFKMSNLFRKFEQGDTVVIKQNLSIRSNIPDRINGKLGIISGMRGNAYIVKAKDFNNEKEFIINPVHLKLVNKLGK